MFCEWQSSEKMYWNDNLPENEAGSEFLYAVLRVNSLHLAETMSSAFNILMSVTAILERSNVAGLMSCRYGMATDSNAAGFKQH